MLSAMTAKKAVIVLDWPTQAKYKKVMKNFSTYFWIMWVIATAFIGVVFFSYDTSPTIAAIALMLAFVFAYAAIMAPPSEKYEEGDK